MPRKHVVGNETILDAAFALLRSEGERALNARRIAEEAGCSVQPLYSAFGGMDGLMDALRSRCEEWLAVFVEKGMPLGANPFESIGLTHVRLARQEPHLFSFLYLSKAHPFHGFAGLYADVARADVEAYVADTPDMSPERARWIYLKMILFTHGIASFIATGAATFDEREVHEQLDDAFWAFLNGMDRKGRAE